MPYLARMPLSLQRTDPEEPTLPVADPIEIKAGDPLPAWTPTFTVNALVNAGMVVFAADRETAVIPMPADIPAQPRTPDQPVILPSDPNGVPPVLSDVVPDLDPAGPVDPADSPESTSGKPTARDSKATWETYAAEGLPEGYRMDRAEAESMSKTALAAEVNRRESLAESGTPLTPVS